MPLSRLCSSSLHCFRLFALLVCLLAAGACRLFAEDAAAPQRLGPISRQTLTLQATPEDRVLLVEGRYLAGFETAPQAGIRLYLNGALLSGERLHGPRMALRPFTERDDWEPALILISLCCHIRLQGVQQHECENHILKEPNFDLIQVFFQIVLGWHANQKLLLIYRLNCFHS